MGSSCGACCDNNRPVTEPAVAEVVNKKVSEKQTNEDMPEPPKDRGPCSFTLQLHSASLARSFANFGWMDPYAVLTVDEKEVGRTPPDKWAHKEPKWNSSYSWTKPEGVPGKVQVAIWDKNKFHKDVLCGVVTVPCDEDMGTLERDFTLTKRNKPTGTIRLTLRVKHAIEDDDEQPVKRMPTGLGLEFDHVMSWAQGESKSAVHLQEDAVIDGDDSDTEAAKEQPKPVATPVATGGTIAPALLGSWKCVGTHGLDNFLKATGVGMFQRKIANAAKWPAWDYTVKDEKLIFVNHSAIGDLKEEIPIGKEYPWKDGHGNPMTCKADWEQTSDGGALLTTRTGSIGDYKEERRVTGDKLEFTLTHGTGVSWGRTFERAK
mmetsp:Transcript_41659/g.94009  ORF Transcript_41659/g.94009 Transcript_41659/m.94009 type:complete len:376 (-) Transcript_41659:27-1154(-)